MLIWYGSLVCVNYHIASEITEYSVTQQHTLNYKFLPLFSLQEGKSKHKSLPRLEYKLGTCDSGWLQFIF